METLEELIILEKQVNDKMSEDLDNIMKNCKPDEVYNLLSKFEDDNATGSNLLLDIRFKISVLEPIEYSDIPNYGKLMTLDEFLKNARNGNFIDYDGHGYYSTDTKMSNKMISPSDVDGGRLRKEIEFTHIMWFNR